MYIRAIVCAADGEKRDGPEGGTEIRARARASFAVCGSHTLPPQRDHFVIN